MMWHWNSLWAPTPEEPTAVTDPALWRTPWSAEQAIALQARGWETMLSAAHSWWTMVLSAWPVTPSWSAWPAPGLDGATATRTESPKPQPHAEPELAPKRKPAVRKRSGSTRKR